MADSLKVAILWHLHQPTYWDAQLGKYRYPWAFLHGARHYHAMAHLARRYPEMRMTFNITPVLMDQLDFYSGSELKDVLLEVVMKPARDLDADDLERLLEHVFKIPAHTMVDPFPRFRELRGLLGTPGSGSKVRRVKNQEVLDLQTLYLLTWCGAPLRMEAPVRDLIRKERDYSEGDKAAVFAAMKEAVKGTIPLYRELQEKGLVEVSTTPYYHPILPLLIDCGTARESRPDVPMEGIDFRYPADAEWQVAAAIRAYRARFGAEPAGMWPAEGSVSDAALRLLEKNGMRWAATDEGILARSIGHGPSLNEKHRPWRVSEKVLVYFRDRELSDRIGFIYSGWTGGSGADDLVGRLYGIRDRLGSAVRDSCVTIILDGENPWEYYPDLGVGFLTRLYESLTAKKGLEPVRFCDHLQTASAGQLGHVVPGSWIDSNFDTWIGAPEKNHAWKLLSAARKKFAMEAPGAEVPVEFYRAEGSDWFWWLGPGHDTPYEASYANIFRVNLMEGLKKRGLEVPALFHELRPLAPSPVFQPPMYLFTPKIDGHMGGYYEWVAAGFYRASEGSIHRTSRRLVRVRFGFDAENLYLRLEGELEGIAQEPGALVTIEFQRPRGVSFVLAEGKLTIAEAGGPAPSGGKGAIGAVVELGIPVAEFGGKPGDFVEFAARIGIRGDTVDRLPQFGYVTVQVPPPDFRRENWSV